ncbi:MAG: tetraprenyl-beta-curcumene synthase family protein [Bacillota bacterium]|nr:tetraprenyl-beta-curcumene synthase family protein [Bacillota bacterium]
MKTRIDQWTLLTHYIFSILRHVERELDVWRKMMGNTPLSPMQIQALNSIRSKRFHCQGGAVYALLNIKARNNLLPLIVSFQTISDYLDNLCDRVSWEELSMPEEKGKDCFMEKSFRHLHLSMRDSLMPDKILEGDYYRYYPLKDDKGYLQALVTKNRQIVSELPSYLKVKDNVLFLTDLYTDLQSYKHLSLTFRQQYLEDWFFLYQKDYPFLLWNEFAAAAGSTLGTFALLALSSQKEVKQKEIEEVLNCYFPWICGLHILLDYFIDQAEDRREGDLNFIFYYENEEQCYERLIFFVRNALERTENLVNSVFHRTVVKGLLALYLSDPKIKDQKLDDFAYSLLHATGEKDTFNMYRICRLLRQSGIL